MRLLNRKWVAAASALTLSACVSNAGGDLASPRPANASPRAASGISDTPVVIGSPYSIGGRTYTPVDQTDYDEVGYASWYGNELDRQPTANGEVFRPDGFVSAAHRTLPLPSYVEVTRLDTGRTILVRINDRGPADPNRLIDLSAAAAEQLGITEIGMAQVRVRRTTPPESERATLRSGEPALPRVDTPDSLLEILRERAARLPRPAGYAPRPATSARPAPTPNAPAAGAGGFVVQVAAFSDRARATALATRIGARVVSSGNIHRVRYGPFATQAEAAAAVDRARAQGQPGAIIQRER